MKKISLYRFVSALLLCCLLFSCSQSKEDKYVGYWVEDGKEHAEILEIQKVGDKLYLKSKDLEAPATYNKEDNTLNAHVSNGIASVTFVMNVLEDSNKMKMSIGTKGADFTKISKTEAEKRNKEYEEYFNPDFFVGEWKSDVKTESPITIIKEGNEYYFVSGYLGKKFLSYNSIKHVMSAQVGFTTISIRRTGDQEITAYGDRTYKRVK
ncbi:hypothetical protein AACH28_16290 [Sphingobacterium thalpophilum]|uniref:Uncharacterized protein n=1 Tax=Sphingobacterium thalpophilum TaxID=259 RepID=A0ACD5BX57_9SPHI